MFGKKKEKSLPPRSGAKPYKNEPDLKNFDKWEYNWIQAYYGNLSSINKMNGFLHKFDTMGKQGWELVGVFSDVAWFKRKLED